MSICQLIINTCTEKLFFLVFAKHIELWITEHFTKCVVRGNMFHYMELLLYAFTY